MGVPDDLSYNIVEMDVPDDLSNNSNWDAETLVLPSTCDMYDQMQETVEDMIVEIIVSISAPIMVRKNVLLPEQHN
eukprot:8671375-Ditylum_brightwellii.AAC.1